MVLALAFLLAAGLGLLGLALVDWRSVPPALGTCAFIVTLAALVVAIVR
ncbi:hypothetical protein ACF1BS_14790 [Streptomyces sp. NPDC014748]